MSVPEEPVNTYIQPSRDLAGQPAQVAQDGWIAYFSLPSRRYAPSSTEGNGRGFLNGHRLNYTYGKKSSF